MSKFKNSILRELGIRESSLPLSKVKEDAFPGIDPENQDGNMQEPTPRDRMMSPTAVTTPVLAISVRGSNTGGLPSGRNLEPSKLGGYEPIDTAKENSLVVDKTPKSGVISNPEPIAKDEDSSTPGEEHPHQVQNATDQPPQAVTGASTEDDSSLKLKAAMPQGIDVDVAEGEDEENHADNPEFQEKDANQFRKDRSASPEGDDVRKHLGINEGKHKAGCTCGFCKNKNRFGKKPKDSKDKDNKKESDEEMNEGKRIPTTQLYAVRQSLQEKAIAGTMSKKESEVFSCITEVLQKRGKGLETRLFGKKTMLETAGVVSERELPHEEVLAAWEDDESSGDYISVNDKGDAYYQGKLIVPSEREKQMVPTGKAGVPPEWKHGASTMNPDWKGIKAWCNQHNYWPNVWVGNDHGNVELYTVNGKPLGGLV